ncbi:P-loop containing nucleoside triphosphate hydrolase protein [Neocallimastix lanati (nom. inval.)]|jgi:Rab-like protein 5|uniref:p-loop containing nucleoside triphosphate hydrolase protein n=1 Tax=Neocallimastix californiae TaxID=1754190 RepID=A0A1Y1ZJ86_9FUNG|nr:P-loop containing nucleoside triphosphate hydrolase protein [Neocallimastix sp. JGI-2020a]ORY10087.1 P-loop containing nucleoside triphosphate hydrolase protein [Neocallimastix californiae]|eukprot:ORY10087.1 P-loop containing nucleoside triphosphate hydrolase protein [Neocallimastix californiae]
MLSSNNNIKIFIIGPPNSGKTAIANYLADLNKSLSSDYTPTQGVRILELDQIIKTTSKGSRKQQQTNVSIELWDCSGEDRFKTIWPNLSSIANGLILVYDQENRLTEKDIDEWLSYFSLNEKQCMIYAYNKDSNSKKGKVDHKIPIHSVSIVDEPDNIKKTFDGFLTQVYVEMQEQLENEQRIITE